MQWAKIEKSRKENLHFLVFPNNTGVSDNFEEHKSTAIRKLSYRFSYFKDNEFGFIALKPIFPRWKTIIDSEKFYTHALDRDTILYCVNELNRLDLQLIKMIEDATIKIEKNLNKNLGPVIDQMVNYMIHLHRRQKTWRI